MILGIFLASTTCLGGMLVVVAGTTHDSAQVAEGFFTALEEGRVDDAYGMTSALYRAWQDAPTMARYFDRVGASDMKLVPWRDRAVERSQDSDMRGILLSGFGDEIDLQIRMAKEDGIWKVLQVADPLRTHLGAGMWFQVVPSREELITMVNRDIRSFVDGLEKRDFTDFYYNNMSYKFQIEKPDWIFNTAYKHLMDDDINLTGVHSSEPSFDMRLPPSSDSADTDALDPLKSGSAVEFHGAFHGLALIEVFQKEMNVSEEMASGAPVKEYDVLITSGFYDAQPTPVAFVFRYVYDHPDWMLFRVLVEEKRDLMEFDLGHCMRWLMQQEDKNPSRCFNIDEKDKSREKIAELQKDSSQ